MDWHLSPTAGRPSAYVGVNGRGLPLENDKVVAKRQVSISIKAQVRLNGKKKDWPTLQGLGKVKSSETFFYRAIIYEIS